VTVRVHGYTGDGTYYLADAAHELDGLRDGKVATVLSGATTSPPDVALRALLESRNGDGHRALDVVIAAPKPMSVLLATEAPGAAREVVALHERSVRDAFAYLTEDERAAGRAAPTAVAFTHGVNRLLDPHLHSHVLVGVEGADAVGDLRALRWRAAAADALYLAAMRDGLLDATGRRAWLGWSGTTLVEGVDLGLVAATTTPRTRGGALERGAEKQHPAHGEARAHWDAQLASCPDLGLHATPPPEREVIDEYRFARALGTGMLRPTDVVRAWGTACTTGERPDRLRAAVGQLFGEPAPGWRRPAVAVADAVGVSILGPRPRDPEALGRWCTGRAALGRYLDAGHRLSHLRDPRGAPAATRLAVAVLDVELADRGLVARAIPIGREPRGARELS
jgi:TrwC relaxase